MDIQEINSAQTTFLAPAASVQLSKTAEPSKETPFSIGDSQKISSLAQLIYQHDVEDFSYSSDKTAFAYYAQDHSLAVQAHSQMDIQTHSESYSFDIRFSAEALGLTAKDFIANNGNPIEFRFKKSYSQTSIYNEQTLSLNNTLRKPYEIIGDLGKALQSILKDRGNKSISYVLDEEARKALMGDSEAIKALGEMVMLMGMINLMKQSNKPGNDYIIEVSGKGKPVLNIDQKTQVKQENIEVEFHFTVAPPTETETQSAESTASSDLSLLSV